MKSISLILVISFVGINLKVAPKVLLASLVLPVSVGEVAYFGFDSYGDPWVVSSSGVANRLEFHYDVYLADFINKAVYVREDFEEVEVTA